MRRELRVVYPMLSLLRVALLVGMVAQCGCGDSGRNGRVRTAALVSRLREVTDGLSEEGRAELLTCVAARSKDTNGPNRATLAFLNRNALLVYRVFYEHCHIGDSTGDGELEFIDDWGNPLLITSSGLAETYAEIGGTCEEIRRNQDSMRGAGLWIWSAGFNGKNEWGKGDDIVAQSSNHSN